MNHATTSHPSLQGHTMHATSIQLDTPQPHAGTRGNPLHRKPLALAIAGVLLLGACASTPKQLEGTQNARARLTQLQTDAELAPRAQVAIAEAARAVTAAEGSRKDDETRAHLAYMAGHKVDLAWSLAQNRMLEDQRAQLSEAREAARLAARTREADHARHEVAAARTDARAAREDADLARDAARAARHDAQDANTRMDSALLAAGNANLATGNARLAEETATVAAAAAQRDTATAQRKTGDAQREASAAQQATATAELATDAAQRDANAAQRDADASQREAAVANRETVLAERNTDAARLETLKATQATDDLQRQIAILNARETDRGIIVTLGDVLFATGRSALKEANTGHLDKLAAFLVRYGDRTVIVEGHTDDVGTVDANQGLSQQRADAVRNYLVAHGVATSRLTSTGLGEGTPVSDNATATGRQQNRRVEVVIANPMLGAK